MTRQPCSRWRTDSTSMRQRLEPRPPSRYTVGRLSGRLATGRRPRLSTTQRGCGWYTQSIGILLCTTVCLCSSSVAHTTGTTVRSIPYGQSRPIRAVCRISPQDSSTCSTAPLRTRPAQNLVSMGAGRAGRPGRLDIVFSAPQPSPDPPDPGLPIAVRLHVPSSRGRFEPLSACLLVQDCLDITTEIITAQ